MTTSPRKFILPVFTSISDEMANVVSTLNLPPSAARRKTRRQTRYTESLAGNIGGKRERNRIKIGCLPYIIVFLSILIWIVLALIFGSEANKVESFEELVLPPVENKNEGDVNEIDKGEEVWVIAAFEVPESWRDYE